MADVDVLIIGGGINGCGIARDAIGRGYSVLLAEQNDLASGTSSWSTKLIHGGLRYLEHYEFRLVREALQEREVLWALAPHIIWPLRFVLPHHKGLRPAWLLRLGLFMYDHLGGRKRLPATKTLDLTTDATGKPLKGGYTKGFEYSDCWVQDSRLVVLNARDAANRGATILTQTRVVGLERQSDHWVVTLEDKTDKSRRTVTSRLVVNAAGPWVDQVLRGPLGKNDAHNVRLVQGSHIVVKQIYQHDRAYIFQNADGRIIFAIPYEGEFTLIGTTDRDWKGDPGAVKISEEEIDYLINAAAEYFTKPLSRSDIVWTYSGVRPLFDDGASKAQEATRDYVLKVDGTTTQMINIFGGKITTYRRLAESVIEKIEDAIGKKAGSWTAKSTLPGGDFPVDGFDALVARLRSRSPDMMPALIRRLARTYGTAAAEILGSARSEKELGENFGQGLSEAEVRYLVAKEWARSAEDILWRRSKLGLHFSAEQVDRLETYIRGVLSEGLRPAAQ